MEFDLSSQPPSVQQAAGYALQGWDLAKGWLLSPAAWTQFGLLVGAWLLAILIARRLRRVLTRLLTPDAAAEGMIARARRHALMLLPLLLPLVAYLLTAAGEGASAR